MIASSALLCLALNVYNESRGEPLVGQYAVATVTMNRAKTNDNVCHAVFKPYQFEWTGNLPKKNKVKYALKKVKDKKSWETALMVARHSLIKPPKWNITNFHTVDSRPKWSKSKKMILVATISNHKFYYERLN